MERDDRNGGSIGGAGGRGPATGYGGVAPGKRTLVESEQQRLGPSGGAPATGSTDAAGQGAATSRPVAAERNGPAESPAPQSDRVGATNPTYVNEHRLPLVIAIMERIESSAIVQPHRRLSWRHEQRAKEALALAISAYIRAVESETLKRMMMLSYPADLLALVDEARRGPAGSRFEAVNPAIATAFDAPIAASIRRMGTRAVVQLDASQGRAIAASSIVGSCPLDGVLADLLADGRAVAYTAATKGARDDTGGKPFLHPLRSLTYEWQGARDRDLWNWIKVTSPSDATVEEVADTFNDAAQAYRIAASPPYFGIPFEIARDVEEARSHAPADVLAQIARGPGPRVADPTPLAQSLVSDEAARAQAPASSRSDPLPEHTLDRVEVQLGFMRRQLEEWRASERLAGSMAFVERRRAESARDPRSTQGWSAVLAAQERLLFAASSEIADVLDEITRIGARPRDVAGLGPVMQVIDAYARAGGVSHLHAEAPAALADARQRRAMLPLALAEDRIRSARGEVSKQRQLEVATGASEPNAEKTPLEIHDQLQRAADLRLKAAHGEKVDPDAVEQLSVDASETALRARLATLATQARAVMRRADGIGLDKDRYANGSWSVHMIAEHILEKVNGPASQKPRDKNDHGGGGWQAQLDDAAPYVGPQRGRTGEQTVVARRRAAIGRVSTQLDRFVHEAGLAEYFQWAYARIADEQLRGLLKSMALQIGLAIATGEIIGAVGAAVRGIAVAGELGAELRGASLLYRGAELLATAGANTATQGALGGEMNARSLAENTLAIALTSAALRPFQGLLHDSAAIEGEIQRWGRSAGRLGKAAAELVVDTGASIGAAGVAHAATHGGEMDQAHAQEWITMGLSIAASKFVHQRTLGMQHRITEATRELKTRAFDPLLGHLAALAKRSHLEHDQRPTPEQALALLGERRRLLIEEQRLYAAHAGTGKALTETKAELAATGPQFADVPLQLAHLRPIVEGHVYEGTSAQIEKAFAAADAAGVPLQRTWSSSQHVWRVTCGSRTIEVHEQRGSGGSQSRRPAHESLRSAEAVPGSGFTGVAPPHETRPVLTSADIHAHVNQAVAILNSSSGRRYYAVQADGSVVITMTGQQVSVRFTTGGATEHVAAHDYVHGANEVTVTISEQARTQDIARAAAHELAELAALIETPSRDRTGVLHKDSTAAAASELSAHDIGRKAELQILLYELHTQPARHAEVLKEITTLVEHLGFDMRTIGTDARARTLLGDANVEGIIQSKTGARPLPRSHPSVAPISQLAPPDVDAAVVAIRSSPHVVEEAHTLDKTIHEAKLGQAGALGELEALQRWIAEGRYIRMQKPSENERSSSGEPRTNPDFIVDGVITEIKTRTKPLSSADPSTQHSRNRNWIKKRITDANKQIANSQSDPAQVPSGEVELQLQGSQQDIDLPEIESQVRGNFKPRENRHVRRVAVYRDGALIGEWIRVGGAIIRRYPA